MKLSVVIPAYNEQGSIEKTVRDIHITLKRAGIDHEIVVVDDSSTDDTAKNLSLLSEEIIELKAVASPNPNGFGFAVRAGLDVFIGDIVAIMMADGSDHPDDLVAYYKTILGGVDCAFGSRFVGGSRVKDYPGFKLVLNRVVNFGIRVLFGHGYDDTTNAFKAYRREVIDSMQPLLSHHFNLTVELPLKAIVRGHSYGIVPIRWSNRETDESKLRLKEMGSRYLFILLYVFFEHHLSRGDYLAPGRQTTARRRWRVARPTVSVTKTSESKTEQELVP